MPEFITGAVYPNISGWKCTDVLSVIRQIRQTGSPPSGARLALLIEGGALRGVVSWGYAMALSRIISDREFDFIYGASSGGLNGIYLASHSMDLAYQVYVENATDPRCASIWNFPNVLNVDWLVDNWMFGPRQFDINTLRASQSKIAIVLTRLIDGLPFFFDVNHASLEDLRKAMKATSYAPLLTEKHQTIDGVDYGDGAIGETFPYREVVRQGATHIICLTTRTKEYRKQIAGLEKMFHRLRLVTHTKQYMTAYFERPAKYNASMDLMYNGGAGAVPTMVLHPALESEIPRSVETRKNEIARLGSFADEMATSQLLAALS